IPEEFHRVIKDFVRDIKGTFPEYTPFISKWWRYEESNEGETETESEKEIKNKKQQDCVAFLFKFCLKKYPPRFFEILYQNADIFKEDSDTDTEFLPFIHFKNLWQCDISDKTRETIWKYLQLILFSVVGSMNNRDAFGDTAKLFDTVNEDDFKSKLEETLEGIKGIFEKESQNNENEDETTDQTNTDANANANANTSANQIHEHITGLLGGKLGNLARELAEEAAEDMNINMDNVTDVKDVFQALFKDPGKLMGLVKNVGEKLDTKLKSGDLKESELMQEASNMIQQMKNTPGMGDIQSMMAKMGMGMGGIPGGAKMNLGAMESKLNQNIKQAQMKERLK
ncbi:MAG: hypothetical protein EBU01_17120, partial [Crocinitomicaceae bacterium]|nr:hypothetical protein [Crocinitomicaceae bacterium]